ncbi:MAG: hypothetical protein MMC33_009813 [Icmadophila ericetorum]|nr:hypothetical protein [Icmadophila ericetorum]
MYNALDNELNSTNEYEASEKSNFEPEDMAEDQIFPRRATKISIKIIILLFLSGLLPLTSLQYLLLMQTIAPNELLRKHHSIVWQTRNLHKPYIGNLTSFTAPVFDKLDIELSTLRVNGSFLNIHFPSIYRSDPSSEVDAAWERIAKTGTMSISSEEVRRLGKDRAKTAKYPPDF